MLSLQFQLKCARALNSLQVPICQSVVVRLTHMSVCYGYCQTEVDDGLSESVSLVACITRFNGVCVLDIQVFLHNEIKTYLSGD